MITGNILLVWYMYLWSPVQLSVWGSYGANFNSVLAISASLFKKIYCEYSNFINRNQSTTILPIHCMHMNIWRTSKYNYKMQILNYKNTILWLAKLAVSQWDSVSFVRDKRMAIHCEICDPVVPWEDAMQHPPASSAVRYSSVAADRCCRTRRSHSETNRGASWIHWSVLCLRSPVSFCLLPHGDWKKNQSFERIYGYM